MSRRMPVQVPHSGSWWRRRVATVRESTGVMDAAQSGLVRCSPAPASPAGAASQEDLAELSGVSPRTVRNLETGKVARLTAGVLRSLAQALHLPPESAAEFEAPAWVDAGDVERHPLLLPRVSPGLLPTDLGDFVGREAETRKLTDALTSLTGMPDGHMPIATVHGRPGVGKTSLAVHVAHRLRDRFPDGQLYANLKGPHARPATTAGVLGRFLRVLGVERQAMPGGLEEQCLRPVDDQDRGGRTFPSVV
jgi:transcriptional regulator with XRE-family HTH domain